VIQARTLLDGLHFGEGPRWHGGRLWFSDVTGLAICSVGPAGNLQRELSWEERPSGLGWMPNGDLLFVSMERRSLYRWSGTGRPVLHADLGGVLEFHANDMVVDADGRAYVGNFGFDLHEELRRQGAPAVFAVHPTASMALVQPDGTVERAAGDLHFPNGTVITPDGRTLIVAETLAGRLTAFTIGKEGRLSDRRLWAPLMRDPLRPCAPDGICLDEEGAIWVANAAGRECIRVQEGGEVSETVETSMNCFACMLGGEDGRTLYMMTGPTSDDRDTAANVRCGIEVAEVPVAQAGRP
jgi:sugar lactone lactonase YvrE